jgi:Cu(I)/Ag(I) efflux system protein CusF
MLRHLLAALSVIALAAGAAAVQAQPQPSAAERAPRAARGTGVVVGVDPKQATVTLKHEPIPALGWPSMTMDFRANPPSLLAGLKVGEKIDFDTNEGHGLPEITAVRPR